jgi:hypothetical protein
MRVILPTWAACCFWVLVFLPATADAQMFGTGGGNVDRPAVGTGAMQDLESVGRLTGRERFLRQNRRPFDFVGPSVLDLERFIGAIQARAPRTPVPPTTEGLRRRIDRTEAVNTPLPPLPRGNQYYPRLEITALTAPSPAGGPNPNALETLVRSTQLSETSRIVVWMEDRTAILLGEVPSARDRDLVELVLSFEPGISAIQNELAVNPQLQELAEDSLGALRQRQADQPAWTTMGGNSDTPSPDQTWELRASPQR